MILKVAPFLMFPAKLEEAVAFYMTVFPESHVVHFSRNGQGAVNSATFVLQGIELLAVEGGPHFQFSEAFSLFVSCTTQEVVDYLWDKLSEGGQQSRCGWLKDRFGLSWQIIPTALTELLNDDDPHVSQKALQAMLKMSKIEIDKLTA